MRRAAVYPKRSAIKLYAQGCGSLAEPTRASSHQGQGGQPPVRVRFQNEGALADLTGEEPAGSDLGICLGSADAVGAAKISNGIGVYVYLHIRHRSGRYAGDRRSAARFLRKQIPI